MNTYNVIENLYLEQSDLNLKAGDTVELEKAVADKVNAFMKREVLVSTTTKKTTKKEEGTA